MSLSGRLAELGIALPPGPRPVAAYVPAVRAGNLVFSSGPLPGFDQGVLHHVVGIGRAAALLPREQQKTARVFVQPAAPCRANRSWFHAVVFRAICR